MSYVDAQMVAPERFTIELLSDARSACASHGSRFELWTHHLARLEGNRVILEPTASLGIQSRSQRKEVRADAVINATGAWVDRTLETLPLQSPLLIGGTKGSHLVLRSQELYEALQGCGIYAEALDDRPVFVLPFLNGLTLVGTTDVPFFGDPTEAKADDDEITYLLSAVARLFPRIALARVARTTLLRSATASIGSTIDQWEITRSCFGYPSAHAHSPPKRTAAMLERCRWKTHHMPESWRAGCIENSKDTWCRSNRLQSRSTAAEAHKDSRVIKAFGKQRNFLYERLASARRCGENDRSLWLASNR